MHPESLRSAIRDAILQRAGIGPDSNMIADATAATCRVLVAQLAPVVGSRGLETLFQRVLHSTNAEFPFLEPADAGGLSTRLTAIETMSRSLAVQPTDAATEASTEFLARFSELLTTFIGSPLTDRLLAPLWGSPWPASNGRSQ